MSKLDQEAGIRLRDIRVNLLKKTTREMAQELGLPQSTYSKYETGNMSIRVDVLANLHKLYNVNPTYICIGTGKKITTEKEKKNIVTDITSLKAENEALKAKIDFIASRLK